MVILSPRAFNMRLTTVVGILGTFKAFKIFLTAFQDVPRCGKKRIIRWDKHLLDGNIRKGDAKKESAGPPVLWESCQGCGVANDHEDLSYEDCSQDIPHVDHLLWSDLGEQEGQVLRHRIGLVGSWEKPVGLQAPVLVVLLNLQHLVLPGFMIEYVWDYYDLYEWWGNKTLRYSKWYQIYPRYTKIS